MTRGLTVEDAQQRAATPWGLTYGEERALLLMCRTGATKEASEVLKVTSQTVCNWLAAAAVKMGKDNNFQAVLEYQRRRLTGRTGPGCL